MKKIKKISPEAIQQIKQLLPELREEVKKGFLDWPEYLEGENFLSDEKVIEYLPSTYHEFIIINKRIHADRSWVMFCLSDFNAFTEDTVRELVSLTLKRLALFDYYSESSKKKESRIAARVTNHPAMAMQKA